MEVMSEFMREKTLAQIGKILIVGLVMSMCIVSVLNILMPYTRTYILEPPREPMLFISDVEKFNTGMDLEVWMITYAIDGIVQIKQFRCIWKAGDYLKYLRGLFPEWSIEDVYKIPFTE